MNRFLIASVLMIAPITIRAADQCPSAGYSLEKLQQLKSENFSVGDAKARQILRWR